MREFFLQQKGLKAASVVKLLASIGISFGEGVFWSFPASEEAAAGSFLRTVKEDGAVKRVVKDVMVRLFGVQKGVLRYQSCLSASLLPRSSEDDVSF